MQIKKKENKNRKSDGRTIEYRKEHASDIALIFMKVKVKETF